MVEHKIYSIPNECLFNEEDDERLTLPEDVIDEEMIKEHRTRKIKNEKLQQKRDEINKIKMK